MLAVLYLSSVIYSFSRILFLTTEIPATYFVNVSWAALKVSLGEKFSIFENSTWLNNFFCGSIIPFWLHNFENKKASESRFRYRFLTGFTQFFL